MFCFSDQCSIVGNLGALVSRLVRGTWATYYLQLWAYQEQGLHTGTEGRRAALHAPPRLNLSLNASCHHHGQISHYRTWHDTSLPLILTKMLMSSNQHLRLTCVPEVPPGMIYWTTISHPAPQPRRTRHHYRRWPIFTKFRLAKLAQRETSSANAFYTGGDTAGSINFATARVTRPMDFVSSDPWCINSALCRAPRTFQRTPVSPLMDQVVRDLLQRGILREQRITHAYRCFLVAKADQSAWFVIDLSPRTPHYRVPHITLYSVARVLATIQPHDQLLKFDLWSGFYQIPILRTLLSRTATGTHPSPNGSSLGTLYLAASFCSSRFYSCLLFGFSLV
jgi:hypothetical protein